MRVGDVGRPTAWNTICFLYLKRDKRTKSLVKIIMYNATCTNSHKDVEEYLMPSPFVAHSHPTSGPNNRSSRPSYSHRCGLRSPKCDCSHWPSSFVVPSDSAHSLGLFRYGGREKFRPTKTHGACPTGFKSIRYLPLRKPPPTQPLSGHGYPARGTSLVTDQPFNSCCTPLGTNSLREVSLGLGQGTAQLRSFSSGSVLTSCF